MLSNAYFLAKFRIDTAENEPAKNLQNFDNFPNCRAPWMRRPAGAGGGLRGRRRRGGGWHLGSFAREEPEEVEGVERAEFRQR